MEEFLYRNIFDDDLKNVRNKQLRWNGSKKLNLISIFLSDLFKCNFFFSTKRSLIREIRKLRKGAVFSQFSQSFSSSIKDHNTYYWTVERANVKRTWTLKIFRTPTLCIPFPASFASPSCHPSLPRYLCSHFITALSCNNVETMLTRSVGRELIYLNYFSNFSFLSTLSHIWYDPLINPFVDVPHISSDLEDFFSILRKWFRLNAMFAKFCLRWENIR